MPAALLGRKIGMTRFFMEDGTNVPVCVIEAGPCAVTQIKTEETDGYNAVQLSFGDVKPRRSSFPVIGHDSKAGVEPKNWHREFRLENDKAAGEYELGQTINTSVFEDIKYVDVIGISKGKGFQGGVKRYGFKGQQASHGVERKHRSLGAICGHGTNTGTGPKIMKGKKMPGQHGSTRVTSRNHDLIQVDLERNLLLVKGTIPGPNNGFVMIRESTRLGRSKARKAKAAK